MPQHEHTYEIIAGGDKVLGQVWWDAEQEKLDTDNNQVLEYLKDKSYQGITYRDGVKFLSHLGRMLKSGYVHARRVEE